MNEWENGTSVNQFMRQHGLKLQLISNVLYVLDLIFPKISLKSHCLSVPKNSLKLIMRVDTSCSIPTLTTRCIGFFRN